MTRSATGQEHDEAAQDAIDGNDATPWMTEHYRSFTKQGVGLVVGANRAVSPKT
jgi:2,4-dienoyl-CoA reductase-like NADH-dependent reductase (Old Yellow Enzyme family)